MKSKITVAVFGCALLCGAGIAKADYQSASGADFIGVDVGFPGAYVHDVTGQSSGGYLYNNVIGSVFTSSAYHSYRAGLGYNDFAANQTTSWRVYQFNNGGTLTCTILLTNIDTGAKVSNSAVTTAAAYFGMPISVTTPVAGRYAISVMCTLPPVDNGHQSRIYFIY
jgi:hypothetical protein